MTSRRSFLGSMAATCAFAAHDVEKVSVAAGRGLARPGGRVFDGMCGAYAAMYTPFFRMGEKTGELNEEMIEYRPGGVVGDFQEERREHLT